jgi:hypothetical protein
MQCKIRAEGHGDSRSHSNQDGRDASANTLWRLRSALAHTDPFSAFLSRPGGWLLEGDFQAINILSQGLQTLNGILESDRARKVNTSDTDCRDFTTSQLIEGLQ